MLAHLLLTVLLAAQVPPPARTAPDLIASVKLADLSRARELLGAGVAVDAPDWRGYTPLMWASAVGNVEMVRLLLERGARADAQAPDGTTGLILAAGNGFIDIVRLLLAQGANPSTTRHGLTARQLASSRGFPDVTTVLESAETLAPQRPQAAVAAPAAPSSVPQVAASLQSLDALLARATPSAGPGLAAHKRAASALAQLRTLSAAWPAETPVDYRVNLAADVAALGAAIDRADQDVLRQSLEAVADDLDAKLEHCQKSGGRLGGSVLVRVRTVQAGQEAARWQVFYMPRIFEVSPTAVPDLFPQLSSPTEELIVPGRYLMWVRNPATSKLGERTVVKVGEGRKELIVDLPVPVEGK
jgi:hypothetical protein